MTDTITVIRPSGRTDYARELLALFIPADLLEGLKTLHIDDFHTIIKGLKP